MSDQVVMMDLIAKMDWKIDQFLGEMDSILLKLEKMESFLNELRDEILLTGNQF